MPIGITASTGTGTGAVLNVSPPATAFGVQFSGNSTAVNWMLYGSVNGTDFVALTTTSTGRTGTPFAVASAIGPVAFVRLDTTVNGSTAPIVGSVVAAGSRVVG